MLASEINYLEREWCKPCYRLAVKYGNAVIKLRIQQAKVENLEFDVNDYTRKNLKRIREVREKYKRERDILKRAIETYNTTTKEFYKECLDGKEATEQIMDFPEEPLQSNFQFSY